ncbi:T9SS type A sorting domain-containing protein [Kaistella sp. G5-32]|uniref:T9SS type A sorting domain-containing protein n=1 Tax=Kaistella gelatinilytica TaxID=2787636 RepID=A0ABS0FD19_9FLAO|nr:T9SS type A sorting domain-containing protein [Kaistella gelatinilytica]MBF8457552.1 T9SS type A sorting domain-containing protein [Kaistella gelatinilytica]
MRKLIFTILLSVLSAKYFVAQDYKKAPNSYIFDINSPIDRKGLLIPVIKAYKMWEQAEYLSTGGVGTTIPAGIATSTLVWEDNPGLIRNLSITGAGNAAKIEVEINRAKGKGNAVVDYKVDDITYWSWHIWVVDEPGNSSFDNVFSPFYEIQDINGTSKYTLTFMDRTLGASSNSFLGNEWNKSSGLSYQYGRKDPFPVFIYKDLSYYEAGSESQALRHPYFAQSPGYSSVYPNYIRGGAAYPTDLVNDLIKYSVNNPVAPILPSPSVTNEPWYSNLPFKTGSNTPTDTDDVTHDLWADNMGGSNSTSLANNKKMKLKSPYDPCPNGWRVPSFVNQRVTQNFSSPWGWNGSGGSTLVIDLINPNVTSPRADQVKFYPGLGVDFRNSTGRTFGTFATNGKYVYYKTNPPATQFYSQDIQSEVDLFSATMSTAGQSRTMSFINDVGRFDANNGKGAFALYSHVTVGTSGSNVKCVKDFNYQLTTISGAPVQNYDFPTEFFDNAAVTEIKEGLHLPNSYILAPDGSDFNFPILKGLAVYNQYLTDHQTVPGNLRANVLWTSNKDLIQNIKLDNSCGDLKRAYIKLKRKAGATGNALVSIENAVTGEIYWSWHIWVPNEDPTAAAFTYTTETERPMLNTIGYTNSGASPLTTQFMDRNLGAVYSFPSDITNLSIDLILINKAKKSIGLFYQWGRKDPLNSFQYAGNAENYSIYKPVIDFNEATSTYGEIISWDPDITSISQITNEATAVHASSLKKAEKIAKMLNFSAQNPTSMLVETATNDWLSSINGLYSERWGHADTKSVFDPCPEGWRIPDFSFLNFNSLRQNFAVAGQDTEVRGTSPWYFANGTSSTTFAFNSALLSAVGTTNISEIKTAFFGVPQSLPYNVSTIYGGSKIMKTAGEVFGWNFANNTNGYVIGNYPNSKALNVTDNSLLAGINYTALWSAAPEIFQRGEAKAMVINGDNMYSGTIVDFTSDHSQSFKPQFAMNVRCAKQLDVYRGDNGMIEIAPIQCPAGPLNAYEQNTFNDLEIYPNPVDDFINIKQVGKFEYQLFDVSGKLVKSGKVVDQKISTVNLPKGIYVLVVQNDHNQKVTKKIIRR